MILGAIKAARASSVAEGAMARSACAGAAPLSSAKQPRGCRGSVDVGMIWTAAEAAGTLSVAQGATAGSAGGGALPAYRLL